MTLVRFKLTLGLVALTVLLAGAPADVLAQTRPVEPGMFVDTSGLVGIGTSTPTVRLHVNASSHSVLRLENQGETRMEWRDTANDVWWDFRTTAGNVLAIARLKPTPLNIALFLSNGDLRLTGSLYTQGGATQYPDDVFEPGYPLMPLSEVASYIAAEGHLPGVTSREEVRAEGAIDMSALQLQLLRKVEELTLYTLAQQETIDALNRRLAALESEGNDAVPSEN